MKRTSDIRATTVSNDVWIRHPQGRIFSRIWTQGSDTTQPRSLTPLLLFHDSLGCVELWRGFPAELSVATGRPVIAYDRLGFGQSDPRPDRPPINFIADEATSYFPIILEQLGITRFAAFGHSVGGAMAVNCAAQFAPDCEALVTESAQVFPEDRTLQSIRSAREEFKDDKQLERLKKYHGEKAKWVVDAWTESWLHPEFASWSIASVLPQVVCPVLAIHGIHDEYGTTRHPEMIGQLSSGPSRVEIIPDTHHVPHRERQQIIVRLVADFLNSVH